MIAMYIYFRPKSNHAKSSALNAGVLVGSQKGDVFDYITNLLENFENVDMNNPRIRWRKGEASNAQQCLVLFLKH